MSATVEILVDRSAALDVLWSIDTALRGEAPVEESWAELGEAIRSAVSLEEYEAHMGRPAVTV